jgi:hypothetical protein
MNDEEKKRCSSCGLHKPLSEFHRYVGKTARSKDGHRAKCKKCRNAYENKLYHENKA